MVQTNMKLSKQFYSQFYYQILMKHESDIKHLFYKLSDILYVFNQFTYATLWRSDTQIV